MVLTTHMVFSQTDGIISVLLDHTPTRGTSVGHGVTDREFAGMSKVLPFYLAECAPRTPACKYWPTVVNYGFLPTVNLDAQIIRHMYSNYSI